MSVEHSTTESNGFSSLLQEDDGRDGGEEAPNSALAALQGHGPHQVLDQAGPSTHELVMGRVVKDAAPITEVPFGLTYKEYV